MKIARPVLAVPLLVALASVAAAAASTPEDVAPPTAWRPFELGSYTRPVSTRVAEAQKAFDQGLVWAYAFNHDAGSLRGVHSYRQPSAYFPVPGGTFAGESLPGEITWARAYLSGGELWMDVGRGRVERLPAGTRDAWWNGTTRQWPFMAADLGIGRDTLMAHYLSNHIAVAYGDIFHEMVALSEALGFRVRWLADGT